MDTSTEYLRFRNFTTHHNDHNMLSCESDSTKLDWRYLRPQQEYRIAFQSKLDDTNYSSASWNSHPWMIFCQLHPGVFPPGWSSGQNPPVALAVESGRWLLRVRGSTQSSPTSFTSNNSYDLGAIDHSWHDWDIYVNIDYTGWQSKTRVLLDSVEVANVTHENGINYGGNSETGGMHITWGSYSSTVGPEVLFQIMQIYHLG